MDCIHGIDNKCVLNMVRPDEIPICSGECGVSLKLMSNREKVGYDNLGDEQKKFYDRTGLVVSTNPDCMVNGEFRCTAPDCGCN